MSESYEIKRAYRKNHKNSDVEESLIKLMQKRFRKGFENYWVQFGYEIGGPVCYSYMKWFTEEIARHEQISDIAFIARDGYLLQKVYNLLPKKEDIASHYVYATRAIRKNCIKNENDRELYREYLSSLNFGKGAVATVDSITAFFSGQRLIAEFIDSPTIGFYWGVLGKNKELQNKLRFYNFQPERYHVIKNWNVMEFIMTSPEPPIQSVSDNRPVYFVSNGFEKRRKEIFEQIEKGVLEFTKDVLALKAIIPCISNGKITKWVNDFLDNPDSADKTEFESILFSETENHSDYIPIDAFSSTISMKDRIWWWSQSYPTAYTILHKGYKLVKSIKRKTIQTKHFIYNGHNKNQLYSILEDYDVVSFDVFDTLVMRPYSKPTDLFYDIERSRGLVGFAADRIKAEVDVRTLFSNNGEVDIFLIYDELKKKRKGDACIEALEEIAYEKDICYVNPDFLELCKKLSANGKKMIAVSDMYLPKQYILEILYKCGYSMISETFVSCDYGVNKGEGKLQKNVWNILGDNNKVIHIGDNFESDVIGSKIAGWNSVLYKPTK
ncbi:MAG: HAD-IA family hydrolase [Aminipila sp.]